MFRVNGEYWRVVSVPPNYSKLYRQDGSLSVACCDNNDKTIYINNTLRGKFFRKVLCHEITHAAMFSYDVNLTVDQEELIANILATYGDEIIYITNKVFNKISGDYF